MKLFDLLEDIDDLNEPACMDKILMYLDEIKIEDEEFMEILLKRLNNEIITWHQPWYQQSNSYSRPLKESDEDQEDAYRTDKICKAESDVILQNWHQFVEEYDVPDKLICLARWKNKDKSRLPTTPEEHARRFVVSYLARGLKRTLFQVFRHIQSYFGGPVKGHYSQEEEKVMQICFTQHPNNAVTLLSMVLGRDPRGIYKRLHEIYKGKPEKKKMKWTLPLATKLVTLLMRYTDLPLEQLKHKTFDKQVWLQLGQDFNQHYIYLQLFWYGSLHAQMFVKHSIKMSTLRRKVFKCIRTGPYQIWSDIRWKDIVSQFPEGYTHQFLYRTCSHLVRRKHNYQKDPLPELMDYALARLSKCPKRRLRTLRFNDDGDLEIVIYKHSDMYEQ